MPRRLRPRALLVAEFLEDRINPVSFSTTYDYTVGGNVLSVGVGDITGDGKPDIVAGNGEVGGSILINDGTGHFTAGTTAAVGPAYRVKLVDLNGDGKLDILAGTNFSSQLQVALGNGNGTFQPYPCGTFQITCRMWPRLTSTATGRWMLSRPTWMGLRCS